MFNFCYKNSKFCTKLIYFEKKNVYIKYTSQMPKPCPPLKGKRAKPEYSSLFDCGPKGKWVLKDATKGVPCGRSKYKNSPEYACDPVTGRYKPAKGYKKQAVKDAPKRPMSAFFLWKAEHGEEFGEGLKGTKLAVRLGEVWRSLDDETKEHYKQIFLAAKKRYTQAVEAYKGSEPHKAFVQVVEKPKKRPSTSGYTDWFKVEYAKLKATGMAPLAIRAQLKLDWADIKAGRS